MLNIEDKNKIYVTADTHLGHNRDFVWGSRGFTSVIDHDEAIINSINSVVKTDDVLFHLGDFCLNTSILQFEQQIARINCQNVYMMWGNHPNPHYKNVYVPLVKQLMGKNYVNDMEVYPLRYKNIIYIGHYAEIILGGQYIVLQHFPIYIWNEAKHGAWMLCGHSHCGCDFSHEANPDGKILDVGWDGHKKPWSFAEIQVVMNQKRFVVMDNHHK